MFAARGRGEAASLLGDELDGFEFELGGEHTSEFADNRPSHDAFTLFSERSPFVGKSTPWRSTRFAIISIGTIC